MELVCFRIRFDETMEKVSAQVTTATEEMLKKRQKEFADSSNENLGQIVNPLKENIAGYALPREMLFYDSLPKTLVGKIAYNELKNGG